MTIGSELRAAREQRGLSLREISERTNIRQPVLRAIENDDFRLVPGSVIMRGFLKLYAREVGLDAEDIGRRYTEQLGTGQAEHPSDDVLTGDREPPAGLEPGEGSGRLSRVSAAVAIALLVLIAAGYFLTSKPGPEASAEAEDSASAAAAPSEASVEATKAAPKSGSPAGSPETPTAVAPAPAAPAAAPAKAEADPSVLRIDLHATGDCWVSAVADGQQVAFRMLNSGERIPIRVRNEAVLRIGIPANLAVSINDQPIRPFARPGTPTTLTITPANYRELLPQ